MSTYYFSQRLLKIAMTNVPPITTSVVGQLSRSGAGRSTPATLKPAIKPPKAVRLTKPKNIPIASGKNLGTTISPRPRTVPNPSYGGTMVR